MGFRPRLRFFHHPALWHLLSVLSAVAGCLLYAHGQTWWSVIAVMAAVWCGIKVVKEIKRIRHNVNYLITAATNNDFSYKFPETDVDDDEKDVNSMLNHIVSHLESMSERAREEEAFLRLVINLVDVGMIVANEKGYVIHYNIAAKRLLSLPVLTDIRQIPEDHSNLEIKKMIQAWQWPQQKTILL